MFKKLISLAIAAMMVVSAGAVAASAAEVEETPVAADESAAVSADDSSAVGAESSDSTGATNKIYFDAKNSGWKYDMISCHVWKADGTGTWTTWGTRKERCTEEADGRWSYDLSNTGNEIKSTDGRVYCVIFYALISGEPAAQTYNMIMSGSCIGDEAYVTGNIIENPEDDAKTCIEAAWRKNTDCGAEKKICSSGNIVGSAFPEGENDNTLLATYLIAYYNQDAKIKLVQGLFDKLGVYTVDVYDACSTKLKAQVDSGAAKDEEAQEKLNTILTVLSGVTGHDKPVEGGSGEPAPTLPKEATKIGETVDKTNNSTGSGTSTGSGSGSSSVSSGQEETIFFVLGGMLLTAAGVMFLARRRRED